MNVCTIMNKLENYILNQYYNLNIFDLLLNEKINEEDNND